MERGPDPAVDWRGNAMPAVARNFLATLGLLGDDDLLTHANDRRVARHAHALRQAFAEMDVVAAFCPGSHLASGRPTATPVLYITWSTNVAAADRAHRTIWSQSLVPLILAITPEGVQVRNGFDARDGAGKLIAWADLDADDRAFHALSSGSLRSSIALKDFPGRSHARVDTRLCRLIADLNKKVRGSDQRLVARPDLANALIARVLYLLVLTDRKVIDQKFVASLRTKDGLPACPAIELDVVDADRPAPWPAEQFWQLSDAIDKRLNGTVFPVSEGCRPLFSDASVNIIRDVLRRDQLDGAGALQLGTFAIDYAALRTETLSELYEQFFAIENSDGKAADGAFYTPSYLVDYVLDETDSIRPIDAGSVICDSAAGSGAFLVGAYRRIVERDIGKGKATPARLRMLMSRCIHGLETNAQAANVARLSLYLTMLDYLPGIFLSDKPTTGKAALFPEMRLNVRTQDFFHDLPAALARKATHVVGNPPWTKFASGSAAAHYAKTLPRTAPVSYSSTGELFAWRAIRELCASDAAVSFVLEAKSFVGSKASAGSSFPTALACNHTIIGVTNLAHFRRKLFEHAEEAATVIFLRPTEPSSDSRYWRYSPLLTSQPLDRSGAPWAIVVDRGVVEYAWQSNLAEDPRSWFHSLMLAPLDRAFAERIVSESIPNLGGFLQRNGMSIARGGYKPETGIEQDLHLGSGGKRNYLALLGLSTNLPSTYHLPLDALSNSRPPYDRMFQGPTLLIPRALSRFDVSPQPVAFNSSVQGIYFIDDRFPIATRLAALSEIGAYLDTDAARYLFSLVGRSWSLDQRRFEARDLRMLPFPYGSIDELLSNGPAEDSLAAIQRLEGVGFGRTFALAVEDHRTLRIGYQNGKVPAAAWNAADEHRREAYRSALQDRLQSLFQTDVTVDVFEATADAGSADTIVSIRPAGASRKMPKVPVRVGDFLEGSTVSVVGDTMATSVRVSKPPASSYWTIESAYADASNVAREILAQ